MSDTPTNEDRFRGQQLRSYLLIGCAAVALLFIAAFLLLSVIGLSI